MIETTDPLLREIDEALRHDRMMAQWKRYRRMFIAVAAVLIVFTLGYTQWQNYRIASAGRAMEAFTAAQTLMKQENFEEAVTAFAALAEDSSSRELTDMAHLWQARALMGANRTEEATALLVQLADQPRSKQLVWRDLACLRLAALDETKATPCLAARNHSPLAAQRKLTYAAHLWNIEKPSEAQPLLEMLAKDEATPTSVREHAKRYLGVIAPTPGASAKQE